MKKKYEAQVEQSGKRAQELAVQMEELQVKLALTQTEAEQSKSRIQQLEQSERDRERGKEYETIQLVKKALESTMEKESRAHEEETKEMKDQIKGLQEKYFWSLALALKLGEAVQGKEVKCPDTQFLWVLVQEEQVPQEQWNRWLSRKMCRRSGAVRKPTGKRRQVAATKAQK